MTKVHSVSYQQCRQRRFGILKVMLKLYTWTTPNGYKAPLLLEEAGVAYEIIPVNLSKGEQKKPEFLAMNPNHKIPVLVDDEADPPASSSVQAGESLIVTESGAILVYLAEKYGKFLSRDVRARAAEFEWLMFQMASVGPMFGQANYFLKYAPEKIEYAVTRYTDEARRIASVLDARLGEAEYLGGAYSIADMATWPWIKTGVASGFVELNSFPNLARWYRAIESRPAVMRALGLVDAACAGGAPQVCVPDFK